MNCLSTRQPWAGLIVLGIKPVENRTWNLQYRGPLLIHAGSSITGYENEFELFTNPARAFHTGAIDRIPPHYREAINRLMAMPEHVRKRAFSRGVLLGQVDVVGCLPAHKAASDWHIDGHWGIYLDNARLFPDPLPLRGQLGIFNVHEGVYARCGG